MLKSTFNTVSWNINSGRVTKQSLCICSIAKLAQGDCLAVWQKRTLSALNTPYAEARKDGNLVQMVQHRPFAQKIRDDSCCDEALLTRKVNRVKSF